MINSEKPNGCFKAVIYFTIDEQRMQETMQELGVPNEKSLSETVKSYLEQELVWLEDSGFYDLSVESIKQEE